MKIKEEIKALAKDLFRAGHIAGQIPEPMNYVEATKTTEAIMKVVKDEWNKKCRDMMWGGQR